MFLSEFTWEEISLYLRKKNGLIVPVGICEQHSKHLPLNTDTLISEYISNYLSEMTNILVSPSVNYGIGLPCDRYYPGTSSVQYEDLKNYVSSIVKWWRLQGFKKFFVITAHGDPFHLKALRETGYEGVYVLDVYDIDFDGILEKQDEVKHACEAETSVILYLYPEKVRIDKIEDFETPFEEFKDYLYHKKDEPIEGSPGCQGYPSFATREKGKKILKRMEENALLWIQKYINKEVSEGGIVN